MKKLIIMAALMMSIVGCEKEEIAPLNNCGCGEIKEIIDSTSYGDFVKISVENECTSNIEIGMITGNPKVGDTWCQPHGESW